MTKAQQKIIDAIEYAIDDLDGLVSDLKEAYEEKEDLSDNWPESEKGKNAQAEIDTLQSYLDELQEIVAPS